MSRPSRPLLQELLRDDPWRMLVGCVLLNVTTRTAADRVWPELFERWPTAGDMAAADAAALSRLLAPLGCHNRRAETLRRMSADFLARPPGRADEVPCLYGLGDYARDSWAIFQDGDLSVEPSDRVLAEWLSWRRRG
jgi:endonuclease III